MSYLKNDMTMSEVIALVKDLKQDDILVIMDDLMDIDENYYNEFITKGVSKLRLAHMVYKNKDQLIDHYNDMMAMANSKIVHDFFGLREDKNVLEPTDHYLHRLGLI